MKFERKIRRAELRDGVAVLRPVRTDDNERITETTLVGVCMD